MSVSKRYAKWCGVCLFAVLLYSLWLPARASEHAIFMMKAADHAEIRESPDTDSAVVLEVEKDTPLLIMGDTDADWYQVQYQGAEGFLEKKMIVPYIGKEELGQEFSDLEQDFQDGFAQVQQHQKKAQQDKVWKIIIAIMIAGIAVLAGRTLIKGRRAEGND